MVRAVIIEQNGGPEVLKIKELALPELQEGEARVRHTVLGLNFDDICIRRGDRNKLINFPAILGLEACGIVEETKGDVQNLKPGDRVGYATAPLGAYCEARNIHHKYLVGIPDYVSNEQAAALLYKGMTAHYLTKRTYFVQKGTYVIVHSAAGGVGMLLTQICKDAGAIVIGTVGSEVKVELAKSNGCDFVIDYTKENFYQHVLEITKGQGVSVVYDGVGKDTFIKSVQSLREFGLMVAFGSSSGVLPALDFEYLRPKSTFLTLPTLSLYKENRMELALSAAEVFTLLQKNIIKDNINLKYKFDEISTAHQDMETRATVGSNIITL